MARISPSQVAVGAIDSAGLSVTVAPRRASDSRYGVIYDPSALAAAAPMHFHPLTSGEYLMVFSRRWHTATPAPGDPGMYTAYTEDESPGWVKVAVPTGYPTVLNGSYEIPQVRAYQDTTLVDAVSRSNEYLYLLTSATSGDTTVGVVTHWWYNTSTSGLTAVAQEQMPVGLARPANITELAWAGLAGAEREQQGIPVVFNRGLWFRSPHLLVFGATADNRLFLARKPWGRIGTNRVASAGETWQGMMGEIAEDPRWVFWTGNGWSAERHLAHPVTDVAGTPIVSLGPVSVATFRDQTFLAVVIGQGDERLARIYSQRGSRPWVAGGTVSLGSVADQSYLDVLRWQQQVSPDPANEDMSTPLHESAIPYVISTKHSGSGAAAIHNAWALWPIQRAGVTGATPGTSLIATLSVTATTTAAAI